MAGGRGNWIGVSLKWSIRFLWTPPHARTTSTTNSLSAHSPPLCLLLLFCVTDNILWVGQVCRSRGVDPVVIVIIVIFRGFCYYYHWFIVMSSLVIYIFFRDGVVLCTRSYKPWPLLSPRNNNNKAYCNMLNIVGIVTQNLLLAFLLFGLNVWILNMWENRLDMET